jgi:hypothetical protein
MDTATSQMSEVIQHLRRIVLQAPASPPNWPSCGGARIV